ncbi:MAG: hypothetical protein Kilf2KO_29110 [Rhodospirillales bacterium]
MRPSTMKTTLGLLLALALAGQGSAAQADEATAPANWAELDNALTALAPQTSLLAAEVTAGDCAPIHEKEADLTTPIGSSFKLYILAELASRVAQGDLSWDDPLAIEDRYRSIPHGPLLYAPDGKLFTLRYLAEQMIQRSDNTATDHLLFLLGREAVEARMAAAGHHDPALNRPLWGTREFAVAKFLWSDEALDRYLKTGEAERRELLAAETRGWPALEAYFEAEGDQRSPRRITQVEWFADRQDLCRLLVHLKTDLGETGPQPTLEVLALADPLDLDRERWPTVGFKGGSEMGVLAGNWLLQRDDGRWFVMSTAVNDSTKPLDMPANIAVLRSAADLLYQAP